MELRVEDRFESVRLRVLLSGATLVRVLFSLTVPRVLVFLSVVRPRVVRVPDEDLPPMAFSVNKEPRLLPPDGLPLPTVLAP